MNRINIDNYFMEIAITVAKRSTCIRKNVGAIIVKENHILTTGFNGAPRGLKHCIDIGCMREKENIHSGTRHEKCRGVHAEQNAIIQAALYGIQIEKTTIYCTHQPCILCSKMIINAGIKKIIYFNSYPDEDSIKILKEANIQLIKI